MQMRITSILFMLCTLSLPVLAMDNAALSIQTTHEDGEISAEDAQKVIESIYQHAKNEDERDQIEEAYQAVEGDPSKLQQRAQQAAPKAPESEEFKKVTQAVSDASPGDKQEYALEALRFLFGEADPNAALYQKAGIQSPGQSDNNQIGNKLKGQAKITGNIIKPSSN